MIFNMELSISEDFWTVTDLKKRTRAMFHKIHRTKRPIVVTVNGKPDVVVLDAGVYEAQQKLLNLKTLLEEGERDVQERRIRPIRDVLKDLRRRVPSP